MIAIESEGTKLEALVYIPAERGKNVKPGMEVRIEPSTVKREEFGTMIGTVETVSEFPITPQGMAAVLHNDNLVKRFAHDGPSYAATVSLEQDASTVSGYRWAVGNGPVHSSYQRNADPGRDHHAEAAPDRSGGAPHQAVDRN